MLLHYLGKFNQKFCTFHRRKTFQMWVCIIYTTDIHQISWKYVQRKKINTMPNINILLLVHSLFLTSLTFEDKQGRPTDHQAVKIWNDGQKPLRPKRHEKSFASLFTKGVQNVQHLHGHMPGDTFFTGQLSTMSRQKSDHRPTLLNCKSLSMTVNKQKRKMLTFYTLLIFALILWHLTDICWIDDKKSHLKRVLRAWELQFSDFYVFHGNAATYLTCGG